MIVVTGAAGFIGSNLVMGLNARGVTDIVAVDDLQDGMNHVQEPVEFRADESATYLTISLGDLN